MIEEKEESKISRSMTIIAAVFLILLILIYFVPGQKIRSILEGKIISNELDQNLSIMLKDGTIIIFEKEIYGSLLEIYDNNQIHEFKVCLHGELKGKSYYLNGIEHPIIYSQDIFSITSSQCSKSSLISLHSHPENQCIHSGQDIESHKEFEKINPAALSAVMCSKTRFNFYR